MTADLSALHVPVHNFKLDNGLRLTVQHDPAAPMVAVHTMYHVGSRHEQPGRTGLAHLLEHLLFEGTENCPKGEYDRLLEEVGGSNNGSTWLDRTNYYETVPPHAAELPLWLERERMAHFLPLLDSEMLELQRGVVMNERMQVYENRPYGLADEKLHQLLFPPEHPYSWPTIGYMDDLRTITLDDARGFYQNFYSPDNAVVVLCGAIEPDEGLRLVEKYLGDLRPTGSSRETGALPSPTQQASDVMEDRVSFARANRAWAVPSYGTRDWVALDLLAYLLGDGETSRLQSTLVREMQIAQDVDVWLYPTQLHGIFGITSTARDGVDANALHETIEREIRKIASQGVGEDELTGALRRVRRDQLQALSTAEERAEELAYAATFLGDAANLTTLLNSYTEVDTNLIAEVAQRWLAGGASLSVIPAAGGAR